MYVPSVRGKYTAPGAEVVERGFDHWHHAWSRTNAHQTEAMTASQAKQTRISKQGNNLNNAPLQQKDLH